MIARAQLQDHAIPAVRRLTGSPFDPFVKSVFPRIAAVVPEWVTPNMVTLAGAIAAVLGGIGLALTGRYPTIAFAVVGLVVVNWICDTLDGVLARQRGQCSKLGDFLDHALDGVTAASLSIGPAFSGLVHPELPLLQGLLILLCFAIAYKGEQVTGVFELLTFGPTEVRFALASVAAATYFFRGPLLTIAGEPLRVLDFAALGGIMWALAYAIVLMVRNAKRLSQA